MNRLFFDLRFLSLLAVVCVSTAAHGGTLTDFVRVESGVFDNSDLAGFNTYAMRIEADTDWTNADLSINLSSGTFNHVAPAFLGSPNGVNGFGDTAGMAPTLVNGDLTGGFKGVAGFTSGHVESPTSFESSWFTIETGDIGVFDIAMITISSDANGELRYRTISGHDVEDGGIGVGSGVRFGIFNGCIGTPEQCIPEPTCIVLAVLGICGMILRRCKSR